ncbi:His Kinase A (phospho-acceptor) domain-containing protein [Mariniphaga anaerophila]|uniref:histidine kinase n=1 Tax=Mariniphaga anaerophila TaxID=1484053 RepID=A0A1M4YY13_9BACT|nr:HAMP domain-containing sensor histidine kinase [Mariniphaga anaerophila]SHF10392.1 His Kinase A (phospho-acceptor) domain-containing protein [Mariniphaga anaerophila]
MFWKINKYSFLVFAICFFVAAAIIENGLLKQHPETHLIADFQKQLLQHEQELTDRLDEIALSVQEKSFDENLSGNIYLSCENMQESGYGFLIYRDGELVYWSDRSLAFYDELSDFQEKEGLVQLPNGYYISVLNHVENFEIIGLHLIKNKYHYENKYLKNDFFKEYKLPEEFEIEKNKNGNLFAVYDIAGDYLFSIKPKGSYLCTTRQLYLPGILYFLGLLILLVYFRREFIESQSSFLFKLFGLAVALFLVYWLHLIFHIPKVFFLLRFFSPSVFALNSWLPSLGDFFLLALFFLFWLFHFGKHLNVEQLQKDSALPVNMIALLLLLFSGSTYLLIQFHIRELIFNSTISFSLNRIIEISAQSVLAIFSVGMLLLAVFSLTIKIIDNIRNDFRLGQIVFLSLGIAGFLGLIQLLTVKTISIEALVLFVTATILATLFSKNYLQKFTLSYLIIFISAASIYSLVVFYSTTAAKQRDEQKQMAITLVLERDPAAEVFLAEIQYAIEKDSVIPTLLIEEEDEHVINYIKETYFSSYFRQYDVRFFKCSGADSLYIEMDKQMAPCFDFFEDMIKAQGVKVQGTNFYFMDNMNGRISYTGLLHYPLSSERQGVSIFIEMNSALLFEGIGFPELLIDKSMAKPENYKRFNYAKYYGGELTDRHGDYNYNFYVHSYLSSGEEFEYNRWDGMEHLIYHTREDNYVIVSRDLFTFVDYLISFPYLFVFYFISVLILLVIGNPAIRKRSVKVDLKFRIQAAIISIVFVSLLVVAAATIWYNVREYKEKHQNDLNEKLKSITEEIDMRLENVDELNRDVVDWLNRELAKLSNIFRTDINIYGTDGHMIASSRPEVFSRGLVSDRMNSNAYNEIFNNYQLSYFQPEKIGMLSYLSAYRPVINNTGEYLGAINLPYFIKQDKYSQELSTIVVAFINLYVLLFLVSIIVAIFIANQITRPLVLIQESFRKMELGKRNEPIYYNRKDEIGSLVKEYNKKVDELAVSADLLARSERESAWREMAKQIAHEIKNPLTPMKLNIQHLQRFKGEGEEYDKYIKRVTSTLIEQIDNLSNIATEFSNFAKIPTARNQVFRLTEQMEKVIDLFESQQNATIDFQTNGLEYIEVNADRDQLSRAIINLIKNGIQSIADGREGTIKIQLSRHEHMAVIAVTDNGEGIPEELQDKLFSPSFTTKSSGMGLGLAIVKNIVENFSGHVWFKTQKGKGSTFYIEIPIWEG